MKYLDEFRDKNLIHKLLEKIKEIAPGGETINIMEVCGTHTQSFFRFGLDKLLPRNINLIAGPGCPVCVSTQEFIDQAIELTQTKENLILSFGDMLRVPGNKTTLERVRAKHGNVAVVYSALDTLRLARAHPEKKVIFLAVGFETTIPTIALSVLAAKKEKLKNLFFYASLKLIPPAMDYLMQDKRLNIDGFLSPGHVSAVIGTSAYEFIPRKYKIPCCIAGFEPVDILEGVYILMRQIVEKKPKVSNQYMRVVTKSGNKKAQKIMYRVFKVADAFWRGLGEIPKSGLRIRKEFSRFCAENEFGIKLTTYNLQLTTKCRCGDVLKGLISPSDCPLFSKACSPENPIGPCMVSTEGACNAYYKYH